MEKSLFCGETKWSGVNGADLKKERLLVLMFRDKHEIIQFQILKILTYIEKLGESKVVERSNVPVRLPPVVYFDQQMHACAHIRMVENDQKHAKMSSKKVPFSSCAREAQGSRRKTYFFTHF